MIETKKWKVGKPENPIIAENIGSRLVVIGRREDRQQIYWYEEKFKPYFYLEVKNKEKWEELLKKNIGFRTIDGKVAVRKYVDNPSEVPEKRELAWKKGLEVYEGDVIYINRYVIDEFEAPFPKSPLRVLYFDVEVEDSLDYINTPKPIKCVTIYDNFTEKYVTFILSDKDELEKREENWIIRRVKTEEKLLTDLLKVIKEFDPDLLVAWNITYDINYLVNRVKKLRIPYWKWRLARIPPIWYNNEEAYKKAVVQKKGIVHKIFGRAIIDLLQLYKKMQGNKELESYSLEYIAEFENLPVRKLERGEISRKSEEDLIIYNKTDVEIMVELNKKLKIIEFWDEVRRTVGTVWNFFFDYTLGDRAVSFKRLLDTYLLRKAKKKGIVLPTVKKEKIEGKYGGGIPILPRPGLHEYVAVLDVTSMYPNIIRTYNISYETLCEEGEIHTPTKDFLFNFLKEIKNLTKDQKEAIKELLAKVPEKERRFTKKFVGLIPEAVNELYERRQYYKKLKKEAKTEKEREEYDLKQLAYKILLNAMYGLLGDKTSRYFKKEVAESVTTFGKALLLWIIKKVGEKGYEVVAGDTDSVFVKIPANSKKEALEKIKELEEYINKSFDEFAKMWGVDNHYHKIEFDKLFLRIFFFRRKGSEEASKKRYIGYVINEEWEDVEDFVIKGAGRTDYPEATKKAIKMFLEMVLKEGKSLDEFINWLDSYKQQIIDGKVDLKEIGIKVTIKPNKNYKNTNIPHLRGLRYAQKLGLIDNPIPGKYYWFYLVGREKVNDVITVPDNMIDKLQKLVKEGRIVIDWHKMLERVFSWLEYSILLETGKNNGKKMAIGKPQKVKSLLEFLKS